MQKHAKFSKFLKIFAKNDLQVRDIVVKYTTATNRQFDTLIRDPKVLKEITQKTKLHVTFITNVCNYSNHTKEEITRIVSNWKMVTIASPKKLVWLIGSQAFSKKNCH